MGNRPKQMSCPGFLWKNSDPILWAPRKEDGESGTKTKNRQGFVWCGGFWSGYDAKTAENSFRGTEGLFIWARSTGLARFPRSRLVTLFFVKISLFSLKPPSASTVCRLLNQLDTKKATGLDRIPCKLLKLSSSIVGPSLAVLTFLRVV